MKVALTEIDQLQQYLLGVVGRADHHARQVDKIAFALLGAVIWRKVGDIEVKSQDGDLKNVLWFNTQDGTYALAYHHTLKTIQLRDRTIRGTPLHSFTNETSLEEVRTIFASL